jgi:rhodanese-related sulfurtransferase
MIKEITVREFKDKIDAGEDFQLIDVREEHEFDRGNLNGELIPMGEILDRAGDISKDKIVIVHCRSGARSAAVINELEKRFGFTNLFNLKGGILAYAKEIDSSIVV